MRVLLAATLSLVVAACSLGSLSGFSGGGDDGDGGPAQPEAGATDADATSPDATGGDGAVVPTTGWQYKKTLTIDHARVSSSQDLTDFPVLFSTTDPDLKSASAGGKLLTGKDLAFFDQNGTALAFEIEAHDPATGQLIAWVKLPTVLSSSPTTFVLRLGNASVAQSPANPTAVWSNDFAGVWHMANASWKNSVNGLGGNPVGGPTISESGRIGAAASFGSANTNVDVGTDPAFQSGSITVSAWASPGTVGTAPDRHPYMILQDQYDSTTPRGWYLEIYRTQTDPRPTFYNGNGTQIAHAFATTNTVNGTWYHAVGTRDAQTGVTRIFVNGVEQASVATTGPIAYTSTKTVRIGGVGAESWGGLLDEVRIAKSARTAGWLAAEHANQSAPATFVSVGALETLPP